MKKRGVWERHKHSYLYFSSKRHSTNLIDDLELIQIKPVGISKLKIHNEHTAIQRDIIPDTLAQRGTVMLGEVPTVMCKNPLHLALSNKQIQIFSLKLRL